MKKSTYHIICAWALLFCFVTGQYMVFAHQHNITKSIHTSNCNDCHNTAKQTFKEKCALCDSMHHTNMELLSNTYHTPFLSVDRVFVTFHYEFKSIALILSSDRGPPVIS